MKQQGNSEGVAALPQSARSGGEDTPSSAAVAERPGAKLEKAILQGNQLRLAESVYLQTSNLIKLGRYEEAAARNAALAQTLLKWAKKT